MPPLALFLAACGLAVGSFIGLVTLRLPEGAPVLIGRSACRGCGVALGPHRLIPLLSFAFQRGRCAECGAPIGWRYPLLEVASGAIGLIAGVLVPAWGGPAAALLGWALLLLAMLDYEHLWLPRVVTAPLTLSGLAASAIDDAGAPADRLAGLVAGYLVLAGVAWGYRRLRNREGLGGGDPWLFGAGGAWVGWQGLPLVLLIAAWSGLAFVGVAALRRRWTAETMLPFGCFLAPAIWLVYLLRW